MTERRQGCELVAEKQGRAHTAEVMEKRKQSRKTASSADFGPM